MSPPAGTTPAAPGKVPLEALPPRAGPIQNRSITVIELAPSIPPPAEIVRSRLPLGLGRTAAVGFVAPLLSLLVLLLVALAAAALAPARLQRIRVAMALGPAPVLMAFLAGISTLVLLTTASAVLVLGLSSVPAIAIIEPLIAAGLTAGLVSATLSAGGFVRRTLRWSERAVVAEVISGALLLFIIGMVPMLGLVVLGGWTVTGLGAIVVTRFGRHQAGRCGHLRSRSRVNGARHDRRRQWA